jgi:lipase chaperone LimK
MKLKTTSHKSSIIAVLTIALSASMVALNTNWLDTKNPENDALKSQLANSNHASIKAHLGTHAKANEALNLIEQQDSADTPQNEEHQSVHFGVLSAEQYQNNTSLGRLPKAILGITLPTLSYDQHGKLIVTENLMQLIEHFLSVAQQDGRDTAIARIEEYISLTLPADAAEQAYAIVQNYLNYKSSLPDLHIPIEATEVEQKIAAMHKSFDQRKLLRREFLGNTVADAFFANEEAYKEYSFSRIEIRANTDLSDAQRESIIVSAEAKLPDAMRQRVSQKRIEANLKAQIRVLQQQGGKEQEIYNLRSAQFGEDAAKKLAYFEDRSENWLTRVDRFNAERQQIANDSNLNGDEKLSAIKQAKSAEFTNKESFKLAYQNIKKRSVQVN